MPENEKNTVTEEVVIAEEITEEAEVTTEENVAVTEETTGINLEFDPSGFTRNADKMGLGMLGIFVVIGIIIIVTSLLSKIKTKEDK